MIVCATLGVMPSCASTPTEVTDLLLDADSNRIATTAQRSCFLERDGAAICWGLGGTIRVHPPAGGGFISIRGGYDHVCGLSGDSTAYCWGANQRGQLGDGTKVDRAEPVRVAGNLRFVTVNAGVMTTCALDARGVAYCWGTDETGSVGIGVKADNSWELSPVPVHTAVRFRQIDGAWPNCGLSSNGRVYCWGGIPGSFVDIYTAPGDCAATFYMWYEGQECLVPTLVQSGEHFVSLSRDHCALTEDGAAFCWGDGYYGLLGDGRVGVYSVPAVPVSGGLHFRALTVGARHVCALDLTGKAYCWGLGAALGIGEVGRTTTTPVPLAVETAQRFVAIDSRENHVCALTADDEIYCWGDNESGQLGPGFSGAYSGFPVRVQLPAP